MLTSRGSSNLRWQVRIAGPATTALVVISLLLAAPASASPKGSGVLISHSGTWTFARLGLPKIVVHPGDKQFSQVEVQNAYRLPRGAKQGPVNWYRIHLHYEVDIAPDSGPGDIAFSMNTNGGYSSQIIFTVHRPASGQMTVTSDALGMVAGHVVHTGTGLVWRGEFENYMPNLGVQGGANSIAAVVERPSDGKARLSRVVVFPDSAIVYSPVSPARLGLHLDVPRSAKVDQRVPVRVTVTNAGGLRTTPGHVTLGGSPQLAPIGPHVVKLPPLDGGQSRSFVFLVRPKAVGQFRLAVEAIAVLSHPAKSVVLRVSGAPATTEGFTGPRSSAWWWWLLIAGALAVTLVLVVWRVSVSRRS